jgi:adenosylhomocysteine nucleosidase
LSPHERPRGLLNLGTAGALRDELEGVHVVGRVRQHDIDGPAIEALTGVDPSPVLELGEGVVLASGDQFISDPSRRARLAAVADLCDMEGYAVAAAALRLGLEATLVKHVSDQAGTGAAASWTDAVSGSSAALGRWLASHPDASVS